MEPENKSKDVIPNLIGDLVSFNHNTKDSLLQENDKKRTIRTTSYVLSNKL